MPSSKLMIDESGKVDYKRLLHQALGILKKDEQRYLYIAQRLDKIIQTFESGKNAQETLTKLKELADYNRALAGETSKYMQKG